MKPYILGAIFARGGSRGVPKKNIRHLNGKPLLAYAIETARAVPAINRLIVSTDSEEIAQVARQYGAEVPFLRPGELASDDASELGAWQHAIKTMEQQTGQRVDVLVIIPTTSPLRAKEDVAACIDRLLNSDADLVVTVTKAHRNPYFNMVMIDENDNARLVFSASGVYQRQQVPKIYDLTTVAYAARVSYILKTPTLLQGKVKTVEVPPERALDIDSMLDFQIAEFLLSKR